MNNNDNISFQKAFDKIKNLEGGYVFDSDDPGGETYKGVSRNNHPTWQGWKVLDLYKGNPNFPLILETSTELQLFVEEIYYEQYWKPVFGHRIKPELAREMFDQAVNLGVTTAVEHMQRTINLLNNNERLYRDIPVDGAFGVRTMDAYIDCLKMNNWKLVYGILNILQGSYYISIMEKKSVAEKYIGWFKRVEIINNNL